MEEGILEVSDFRKITGLLIESDDDLQTYRIANRRASNYLTRLLGWQLGYGTRAGYRGVFEETAKAVNTVSCPTEEQYKQWLSDPEEYPYFTEGEEPTGEYKLFPFHPEDTHYLIDPAVAVYSAKLVKIRPKDDRQFFTVMELSDDDWEQKNNLSTLQDTLPLVRYIEICKQFDVQLENAVRKCWTLCIDADWCKGLPEDLKYILAEMVLFYMNNVPTLGQMAIYPVTSESVDGHSVSYNTKKTEKKIATIAEDNMEIIMKYIGPYSPLYRGVKVL